MISVITGDIIKSRSVEPHQWLPMLKSALSFLESDDKLWDVYRGDSFQIQINDPKNAFIAAVYLKACIKTAKALDVRLAIGIGNTSYEAKSVTESNGEAFQFSGETLESLKKEKLNLKLKTNDPDRDNELNLMFKLALLAMDNWTSNSAEIVKLALEFPEDSQEDLGKKLGINQTAVSRRQQRAQLDLIYELNHYFKRRLEPFT